VKALINKNLLRTAPYGRISYSFTSSKLSLFS